MKKIFQFATILAALSLLALSCNPEELSTEQFETNAVVLQAYGPQPVVRGGVLRFIGSNLQNVASVTIPADNVITEIEVVASGAHSEIRVTVPKETSEPGFPVLTLKDGTTIVGKTALTYSEPITIDEITPAEILPGADLTIKGDYLNLIHEVIFTDKVKISEEAFKAHDRYTIKVTVPETARTGKVGLGTIDELAIAGSENEKDLLATLNIVESETEIVVTTAKGKVAAAPIKAGANVDITGTNLKLAKSVKLEGATVTEFTATDTKITFALPATVNDGEVVMVMASGVEVSADTLTTVKPTITAVAPVPVKNGAELTITGTDLDLVTGVDLVKAANVDITATTATSITLTVPEKAQEGPVTLKLANGATVVDTVKLVKPVVTAFSANPAAAGSPVTVTGTDLDLVATVTFEGGIKVELADGATATAFTVDVPTTANKGALVLNLKNGTDVVSDTLDVAKPAGAYLLAVPETVFQIGDMFVAEITNEDHLQKVKFDDIEVQFLIVSGKLYAGIPAGAKAGTKIYLVSDNGTVAYDVNIDPGTQTAWVIWEGNEDMGSWSNQPYVGTYGFLAEHPEVVPGDVIRFSLVGNADWWQIQLIGGNWGDPIATADANNAADGTYDIVLTQAIIDKLNALDNWGGLFVVQGEGCTLTQITVIHYIPQETVIWEGSEDMGSWSNQPYLAPWGYLKDNGITAGAKCRFYITGYADWYQVQIIGGNWGDPITVADANNVVDGQYEFELTQEIVDKLNAIDNWGGLFVVQGESCIITKISLIYLVK